MSRININWKARIEQFIDDEVASDSNLKGFALANTAMIEGTVTGRGPDDATVYADAGARMVVNISSAHVPAFCEASRSPDAKPYKNGYDLGKYRIGTIPSDAKLKSRELVDLALPLDGHGDASNVYFGAVELNGTGIRFYGDVCLVLRPDTLDPNTVVLDRNSYDLLRSPISDAIEREEKGEQAEARKEEAWKLRGTWNKDLGSMAALKVLQTLGLHPRRCTTGQISEGVRDDEDYMEVLKIESFGATDLQEARFSAAEAAYDALTGDRLFSRPAPRMEALMWRKRRSAAEEELRRVGVQVRVVTTSGRTRD